MRKSLDNSVQKCSWTEVEPPKGDTESQHAVGPRLLDLASALPSSKHDGFSVVQILPKLKDIDQFQRLPSTLTKAHTRFAEVASKRGYNFEKWVKPGETSWQIPNNHPGQDRANCLAQINRASTGEIMSVYDNYKKIERVSYVMRAEYAYIHPTGSVGLECGYFRAAEGCETRWDHAKDWWGKCTENLHPRSKRKKVWRSLWSDQPHHPGMHSLYDLCADKSELSLIHI